MKRWLLGCSLPVLALALPGHARADAPVNWNHDTLGEIGMLDMPTAHVAPDGQLSFVFGDIAASQRFSLSFQALPWLETSFRYSRFDPVKGHYDRSFSLKARLLNEEENFADVALGIRDLLGTGVYSSEYLAVSKHVGPVDLTVGAGWGRLADSGALPNPFAEIFSSFNTRAGFVTTGGVPNFGQFFHGPRMGLFGGATWETPIEGLNLIAEYSSDGYVREQADTPRLLTRRSPVNLGVAYQVNENLAANAGWYYGDTYGLTLTLMGNPFNYTGSAGRLGPEIPAKTARTDEQQKQAIAALSRRNGLQAAVWQPTGAERDVQDLRQALFSLGEGVRGAERQGATLMIDARAGGDLKAQCAGLAKIAAGAGTSATTIAVTDLSRSNSDVTLCPIQPSPAPPPRPAAASRLAFERRLRAGFSQQGLALAAVSENGSELWVYYTNFRYQKESQAAGRIIRLLMRDADPDIELFHLVSLIDGVPTQEIDVARSAMERLPDSPGDAEIAQAISFTAPPIRNPALDRAQGKSYPGFQWGISPLLSNEFFDPDTPLGFRLMANLDATVTLAPGLDLGTALNATIFNTFNLKRGAGSELPHVRTDFTKYADQGANGITYLALSYLRRLAPDTVGMAKVGYLEDMFAGVGGEVLWRPENSRVAIGADAYEVWQRNFNRLFGLQDYHVATGHVTVYYESPWYGLTFAVHGGRYLAGDYGATFEVTRRFDSGLEIGAFATFTNVPFSKFGEGSFDKGIILRMPLEWGMPIFTKASYDLRLQALNRDGGQRLLNDDSLYHLTRPTGVGDIMGRMTELADP